MRPDHEHHMCVYHNHHHQYYTSEKIMGERNKELVVKCLDICMYLKPIESKSRN